MERDGVMWLDNGKRWSDVARQWKEVERCGYGTCQLPLGKMPLGFSAVCF